MVAEGEGGADRAPTRWIAGAASRFLATPAYPALLLLAIAASIVQPRLVSIPFLLIVLRQAAPLALAAIGQSMPMITRSIDLSVGGMIALSNVVLALPVIAKGPAWWSFAAPLAIGALVGIVNAVLVGWLRASAVVATLGMSIILLGASYVVSNGAPGGQINEAVRFVSTGRVSGVPVAALLMLAYAIIIAVVLRFTVFGHALRATGASHSAAWLSGIPVQRVILLAHLFCGLSAGLAGIVLTGYIGTGTLNLGAELVLASVAAVVLGGTSFGGGQGGILGVVVGAFALTFLANLLTGIGVPQPVQLLMQGAIIASAAAISVRRDR